MWVEKADKEEESEGISAGWLCWVATDAGYEDLNTSWGRNMRQRFVFRCILSQRFCAGDRWRFALFCFFFSLWTPIAGGILMSIIHRGLITPFPVKKKEGLGQWSINFSEAQLNKHADVNALSPTLTHAERHSLCLSLKVPPPLPSAFQPHCLLTSSRLASVE